MVRRNTEEKERIRKEILRVSEEQFFDVGYSKTSTAKIAKAVGIAEGTVFNYFKTKSDILLEIISSEYYVINPIDYDNISQGVAQCYLDHLSKSIDKLFKLPKKILLDMFITILNVSKKNPKLLHNLAALDFRMLEDYYNLTSSFVEKKILKPCDERLLSEAIFASICYEILLYFYTDDDSMDDMYKRLEKKIEFELFHYMN